MFLPALAVLVVSSVMNEAPRVRWGFFPRKYLLLALFLVPSVLHAVMLPLMVRLEGGVRWQEWLVRQADGLYHAPASRGWGVLTVQGLVGHILLNAIVGLAMVSFLAFSKSLVGEPGSSRGLWIGFRPSSRGHLSHLGVLACPVPFIGDPAHRRRIPDQASSAPPRRHNG